jgi:hypothetical protein
MERADVERLCFQIVAIAKHIVENVGICSDHLLVLEVKKKGLYFDLLPLTDNY